MSTQAIAGELQKLASSLTAAVGVIRTARRGGFGSQYLLSFEVAGGKSVERAWLEEAFSRIRAAKAADLNRLAKAGYKVGENDQYGERVMIVQRDGIAAAQPESIIVDMPEYPDQEGALLDLLEDLHYIVL